MSTTEHPALHITSRTDLFTAVPYLLGFHPEESLVVVGVDDTSVVVTARVDLDDLGYPASLADVFRSMRAGSATGVVVVFFTDQPMSTVLAAVPLSELAHEAGLELLDTLVVAGGRWRSLHCAARCCPAEGTPVPSAPTAIDAAAVYAGMTAMPTRAALTELFAPMPNRPDLAAEVLHELHIAVLDGSDPGWDRAADRALFTAAWDAAAGIWPTDEQAARFGVALASYSVRDALWLAVDDGRLTSADLWINLARRLPNPFAAMPLFLAAWRAYRDGNGALAAVAAELAAKADPMSNAAELLLTALRHGVDPRTLPTLRAVESSSTDEEPASS